MDSDLVGHTGLLALLVSQYFLIKVAKPTSCRLSRAFLCPIPYTNKFVTCCNTKKARTQTLFVWGFLFFSWAILDSNQ